MTMMTLTPPAVAGRTADDVRRRALAAFLRSRRERISPEQAGLPRGPRRRTPGLRREEVAQLAAVGVTWYTWLEQAREIQVSAQVLDAVARALMLDRGERSHLFALAGVVDPLPGTDSTAVTPALRRMLDALEPLPACLQNARYDILAHNRMYGRLMCDLDALPPEERNCLWLHFVSPEWRAAAVNGEEARRAMAAKFRSSMAEHIAEPAWKCLLRRLLDASEEFRRLWAEHEVVSVDVHKAAILNVPRAGLMRLDHTSLWTGPTPGTRLITFTPADAESDRALRRLHAQVSAGDRPGPGDDCAG
ncbi:transcriptional regulator with XRE-family HTH domain [Streptomyces olivoverticillatus]|uniref:Transcriptional regulator with XRE-family HTH domain n=2 Tax=Streptomyces olivoverticillatus TaxID=66427 RepID=A0A7W7LMR7_9ACTN|nr:transcriptional regulator with XRE-family HTH domain [Streptomyces olivoverticillatus]